MASKRTYYIAAFVGSIIGSIIPRLFGAGILSFSAVLLAGIGGLTGILIVWKLNK